MTENARPDYFHVDLDALSVDALRELQWSVERTYAKRIRAAAPGTMRAAALREGYELVAGILERRHRLEGGPASFGLQARDVGLVHRLLGTPSGGGPKRFFELGFGAGHLLESVARAGHRVAGVEVADTLVDVARARVGASQGEQLRSGDFGAMDLSSIEGTCDLAYWNDVIEHVHPDEVRPYVVRLRSLLRPGGVLVTITPNWHVRPSDITRLFRPARATAEGLHLKEYTLRELVDLLTACAFERVRMPLMCTRRRSWVAGDGLVAVKRAAEPMLERLPVRWARIAAGGLGYYCVIASKPGT